MKHCFNGETQCGFWNHLYKDSEGNKRINCNKCNFRIFDEAKEVKNFVCESFIPPKENIYNMEEGMSFIMDKHGGYVS